MLAHLFDLDDASESDKEQQAKSRYFVITMSMHKASGVRVCMARFPSGQ